MKDKGTVYFLWWFTCLVGGHSFYLGKPWKGLLQAFTFGGLGIWIIIDFFTIPWQVSRYNEKYTQKLKGYEI
jgi:TM2 domain-containing membrane protein YozV